ncbi:Lrp/AsnC family transcriptional regulator [Pectinatus brassicae]|uniref:Lrp/AsnC family leucine-responsive transcriptional regulator n=1 Tax=Pectinatus brassicae TaxID=862415 RepID=A0A840UGZ4_9FIRM|nr:Lrp/AsnC family transcriptional regulator [Pectinatus brassicae]MBB5336279.1 Lrp/AsnC family leucine-responsive transcriptional regulator [Pectinatus brassicae]
MKKNQLDHIDRKILQILQKNARTPIKEIAEVVFLSSPAVSARIKYLVDANFITGFYTAVNEKAFDYHIKAYINVDVDLTDKKTFYPFIRSQDCVIECDCVTGEYSMMLKVMFPSTDKLDKFIDELQKFGKTETIIVFSNVVEHRGIKISD